MNNSNFLNELYITIEKQAIQERFKGGFFQSVFKSPKFGLLFKTNEFPLETSDGKVEKVKEEIYEENRFK